MLGWSMTFLLVAIVAGLFGFGVIGSAVASVAQLLFLIFMLLFLASLLLPRAWGSNARQRHY